MAVAEAEPALRPPALQAGTLTTAQLACRRGDRVLFKGLDLKLLPGEAIWLRGHNGCGKTSLLRLIVGLSVPEAGTVAWNGVPIAKSASYARERLYIAHGNALKDDLTVIESLAFLARIHGCEDGADALQAALASMGIAGRRNAAVRTLSQGQRRRAALARLALDHAARLWVLDEPYDALDPDGIVRVDALLRAHLARNGSVLLTSHLPPGPNAPPMTEFDLGRFA
ncbi:MAG: cytochrome c biogenesis heme-transporting ATPase CcmA [Burkholderiaceae bacterium]